MKKGIEDIAQEDGRYDAAGIRFVYDGLGHTVRQRAEEAQDQGRSRPRHITGQEFCEGLRDVAVERWGRLASVVLEHWGVRTTHDFGEIVYLMIRHQWMTSQPSDMIEDFDDVYDFRTVFEDEFEFELKKD